MINATSESPVHSCRECRLGSALAAVENRWIEAKTVQRRMSDPAFSKVVSERRRERFGQLSGQLLTAGNNAMDVLTAALQSEDPKVSLQAAGLILSHGHRYNRVLDDHETELRFEAIEQALEDEATARAALLGEGGSGGQR